MPFSQGNSGDIRGIQSNNMRAVIQRVKNSKVTVDEKVTGAIGRGLMVLIGVEVGDSEKDAQYIADKVTGLRINIAGHRCIGRDIPRGNAGRDLQ